MPAARASSTTRNTSRSSGRENEGTQTAPSVHTAPSCPRSREYSAPPCTPAAAQTPPAQASSLPETQTHTGAHAATTPETLASARDSTSNAAAVETVSARASLAIDPPPEKTSPTTAPDLSASSCV